ncbi:polyunsaturated fatty acid lipoxygenase ALOX15B-like isoform X1 [Pseudochaenichthys georgianus]|uniref:polyunsaturated fatty acid lipoxygenase ALOX15B-like isoform X1 n=1 Tax=Pseudochaenichthys georgianus TaxID=52239 RepID=UPI00146C47D7|nr:arachidonate 15-lipoxygenase B-like isoform X1 [Pseudochaenichthys georgianus]XP_033940093.1 arachidonate 15-lipoxygenase B-like isoform X1 [Pseudochaenichthys georgianus]
MVDYKVTVSTGCRDDAGTSHKVYIKLMGRDGESKRTWLEVDSSFIPGAVSSFTVSCPVSIGELHQIELDKKPPEIQDDWFPVKVVVESPEGDTYKFPIFRSITTSDVHYFDEEKAPVTPPIKTSVMAKSPQVDPAWRETHYHWHSYGEGMPHCMKAKSLDDLPLEVHFSWTKSFEFYFNLLTGLTELNLKGLADSKEKWTDLDDIRGIVHTNNHVSGCVRQHWKEDAFFGYQYLNGVNPMLIRHCSALPNNFPVTDEMVFPSGPCSLAEEIKKGNIFLCDYKLLDGLKANIISRKQQYMAAPLVLLHKTPDDKLKPVAIQLKQTPAGDNPIFLPTDSEYDWLMAKVFVRSADFNLHQLNFHLLRTHLLAEVFTMSLMRNVSRTHLLHKLLLPHTRYTLHINFLARKTLIFENGAFSQFVSSGGEALKTILKRSLSSLTYSSLCIPEDITERGLEAVPNFYYRDDGLKLWDIIQRFVQGMLSFHYESDAEVWKDGQLQDWISEIFKYGFLSQSSTGIPQSFTTVEELVKFVTMVIFTCSGQHSAVNSGQYDYGGWMPNSPSTMQLPPPTRKGTTSEETLLQALPNKGETANAMATLWLLSNSVSDTVHLGHYPDAKFDETIPCELIRAYQGELQTLSAHIRLRNLSLEVPYTYMDPEKVENSVAI